MPSVSITWRAVGDARTCPLCLAINGYTWTFTDTVPDSLIHPQYDEIWNITTGSLAHEQKQFGKKYGLLSNCRCHIEPQFDLKDLLESVTKLRNELQAEIEVTP
jgi:uncharacterized protein with gpF-like domain